jgi:hypothetical protein
MDITVGISRAKAREFLGELTTALEEGDSKALFEVKLYGKPNGAENDKDGSGETNIVLSNDDMEREEVAGEVYVDFESS